MARVVLDIRDPAFHLTLKTMLCSAGHAVVDADPEVILADTPERALQAVPDVGALILTAACGIADAVAAMRQGVYGYVYLPLQPGEAPLMVARAAADCAARRKQPFSQEPTDRDLPLHAVEKEHILRVLKHCKGNQLQAARLLGIGRNTLWRKLRAYGEKNWRD